MEAELSDPSLQSARTAGKLPGLGKPPTLILVLFAADLLMGALAILGLGVTELTNLTGGAKIDMFRLGEESNVPTWFSSSQLLLVALAFCPIVIRDATRGVPGWWKLALAPILFALLSLDEAAMLHERVGDGMRLLGLGTDLRTGLWMVVAVPVFFGFLAVIAWGTRHYWEGRRTFVRLFGLGIAVFIGSAVGLELLSNLAAEGSLAIQALGWLEEVGEMVGATILLWSAIYLLRLEGIRLDFGEERRMNLLWR